jgi:hypothetical protein
MLYVGLGRNVNRKRRNLQIGHFTGFSFFFFKKSLAICAIVLLIGGIRAIWIALRNSKPTTVSLSEVAAKPEKHHWLLIKNCEFKPLDAIGHYHRWEKSFSEVLIPVPLNLTNKASPIPVLIASQDPVLLGNINSLQATGDLAAQAMIVAKNPSLVHTRRDVTGVVRGGLDLDDRAVFKLRKMPPQLTEEFVILEDGKKPRMIGGLVMVASAIGMVLILGV